MTTRMLLTALALAGASLGAVAAPASAAPKHHQPSASQLYNGYTAAFNTAVTRYYRSGNLKALTKAVATYDHELQIWQWPSSVASDIQLQVTMMDAGLSGGIASLGVSTLIDGIKNGAELVEADFNGGGF